MDDRSHYHLGQGERERERERERSMKLNSCLLRATSATVGTNERHASELQHAHTHYFRVAQDNSTRTWSSWYNCACFIGFNSPPVFDKYLRVCLCVSPTLAAFLLPLLLLLLLLVYFYEDVARKSRSDAAPSAISSLPPARARHLQSSSENVSPADGSSIHALSSHGNCSSSASAWPGSPATTGFSPTGSATHPSRPWTT